LKLYLARAGYTAGPLFRASLNGDGGPLSYDAAHHCWQGYCARTGVDLGIHQLRHAHATSYSGVSIEAVRRRLQPGPGPRCSFVPFLEGGSLFQLPPHQAPRPGCAAWAGASTEFLPCTASRSLSAGKGGARIRR
jgi:hypothetical protein